MTAMMDRITRATIEEGVIPLGNLKKLKVTGTHIGIVGLGSLLKHCGNKIESLDISYTRVGGEGALQILFVLLGFSTEFGSPSSPVRVNNTLRKLNLSGLSLPQDDLSSVSLDSLTALQIFDFKEMRTRPQDSGSHDLALGIKNSLLTYLMLALAASAEERKENSGEVLDPSKFSFERISISNRIIMDKDARLMSPIQLLNLTSVKVSR